MELDARLGREGPLVLLGPGKGNAMGPAFFRELPLVFSALERDESVRPETSPEALAKLKPVFKEGGTVTAGNAPGTNDGAAAVVVASADAASKLSVEPFGRVVAQSTSGVDPKLVMMAPVDAVKKLLAKTGWKRGDVDLVELNEAFAVQAIAVARELELDLERVNVNGGAVALGHPIGASGGRIVGTLVHELRRNGGGLGLAAICSGGGQGDAVLLEV